MKISTLSLALAVLSASNMVEAAPAPQILTVWQTATQVINTDGSIYSQDGGQTVAAASTTQTATASATTAASTSSGSDSSSSSFSLDSLLSGGKTKVKEWLSKMFGSSDLSLSTSTSTSTSTSSSSESTGSSDSLKSFFESLFGGSSSESSSGSSTSSSSNSGSTTTSNSGSSSGSDSDSGLDSGSGSSSTSTYTPSTLATVGTSTVSSESSSTASSSSIYSQIYDSPDIDQSFAIAILNAHNTDRAQHLAAALSWDKDAYDYAQNVADNYDCSGVLTHTHGQYGENLACGYKSGPSSVQAWYDEGETYDYSTADTYNHFTQVVWKSTTKVGCAYKDCSSNNWGLFVVCEYDPAGNVIGEEKANVLE